MIFPLRAVGKNTPYNLVENGDFDGNSYSSWEKVGFGAEDGLESHTKHSGNYALQFKGDPKTKKQLYSTINASIKSGEGLVYGCWIKSGALPNKDTSGEGKDQSIGMTIALSKGSAVQYGNLVVTPSGRDWIYVSNKLIANADYDTIKIYLKCNYNANFTYFDDVTIFKDVFGESFSYDSKGNVISVVDMAKNTASISTNAAKTDITSYKDGAGNT